MSDRVDPDRLLGEVEVEADILDELERIKQIQSQLRQEPKVRASFERTVSSFMDPVGDERDATGVGTDPAPIVELMRLAQSAFLRHPAAAAFVFAALVDEGRNYVETAEGQARADALAADPVMNELRRLWEATSLNVMGDGQVNGSTARLPDGWIDLIVDSAASATVDAAMNEFERAARK